MMINKNLSNSAVIDDFQDRDEIISVMEAFNGISQGSRAVYEAVVRFVVGKRPPCLCSSRSSKIRSWRHRIHFRFVWLRFQNHSARSTGFRRPTAIARWEVSKKRGGRKKTIESTPGLNEAFEDVLKDYTAGDPMKIDIQWTNLTNQEITERLNEAGFCVSRNIARQLLNKNHYVKRKAQKSKAMKHNCDRNSQFENIAFLKEQFWDSVNPILSMDTKKKEYIGNFYRDGRLYTRSVIKTFDHDFNSFAEGVIIPHGLFDLKRNIGYLHLGTSRDTSEFACDNIERWWLDHGRKNYPLATSMLLLCDGGGSNNANHYLFKEDLQKLSDRIGINIRVAHYPPYTSKYNPIEHRLFSHVSRACQGMVFESVSLVKELMLKTQTKTGLRVFVEVIDKLYQIGRKYSEDFRANMKIRFEELLPKWNYTAVPTGLSQ